MPGGRVLRQDRGPRRRRRARRSAYGTTGIPGRRSASELIKEPGQPPANVQVFLEAMKDAPGPTWAEHLQNRKIWQACGPPLQGAFDGDTSVREAAAHAQQEIAAVMAQG